MPRTRSAATLLALALVGNGLALSPAHASSADDKAGVIARLHSHHRAARRAAQGLKAAQTLVVQGSPAELALARRAALVAGATVTHDFSKLGALSLRVPSTRATRVSEALAGLRTRTHLAGTRHYEDVPNDGSYSHQSLYYDDVHAPTAWATTHGSASVKIAVIDSGIDTAHPDLVGKVVAQYNAHDGSTDVTDTTGHGTFVAGVAAAQTNNTTGVAGAGFDSSLMAVKVEDEVGDISVADEAAGIVWAADHGANVISISLGSSQEDSLEDSAVKYAQGKGAVVVAAAGNEQLPGSDWPGAIPDVISVAALGTSNDQRASFSNHGAHVAVAAPGVGIYSTAPVAGSDDFVPSYDTGDGTSFSTPMVSGEVALLAAYAPSATAAQLRNAVVSSALPLPGQDVGAGKVQFDVALTHLPPTTTPTITTPLVTDTATGDQPISADSSAAQVQFAVDGVDIGPRIDVAGGHAPSTWSTYGLANASHQLQAKDCNSYGCGPAAAVAVAVSNGAPSVTGPTTGQDVTGVTTLTATAPGGSLAFYVDGHLLGVDTTAPFSYSFNSSTVTDGNRAVHVVTCTVAGTLCAGTVSPDVAFTSHALHPRLATAPYVFSPNGDGHKDLALGEVTLPDVEHVDWYVTSATSGATVNGPHTLGNHPPSTFSFLWNGKTNGGSTLPDGYYTVKIVTAGQGPNGILRGLAASNIRIDNTKPALSGAVGVNAVVYPYKDGYVDAVTLGARTSESGTGYLNVFTTTGQLVGQFGAVPLGGGIVGSSWRGTGTSPIRALASGTYRFQIAVFDPAGNIGVTPQYAVGISPKKIANHTLAINVKGGAGHGSASAPCAEASQADSYYTDVGIWLANGCDPALDGDQVAVGQWTFGMPPAVRYDQLRLDAYGYSYFGASSPTTVIGALRNVREDGADGIHAVAVNDTEQWVNTLASGPAKDHVYGGGMVDAALIVFDDDDAQADFDIKQVRLVVNYDTLV